MPRFYILEKVAAHKQGRRAEYTRLVEIVSAPDRFVALRDAQIKHGFGVPITVQAANPGYNEGR